MVNSLPSGVHWTWVRWYLAKFTPLVAATPKISSSVVGAGGGMNRSTGWSPPGPLWPPAIKKRVQPEHLDPPSLTLVEYVVGRLIEEEERCILWSGKKSTYSIFSSTIITTVTERRLATETTTVATTIIYSQWTSEWVKWTRTRILPRFSERKPPRLPTTKIMNDHLQERGVHYP